MGKLLDPKDHYKIFCGVLYGSATNGHIQA